MQRTMAFIVLALGCTACGSADPAPSDSTRSQGSSPGEVAGGPGAPSVMFEMTKSQIPPGTEAMHCHYLPPLEQDLVVRGFSTRQAPGGHHLVIYSAIAQKPAGTLEDCSTGESMSNLMLVLTQTGTQEPGASAIEFPEKHVKVLQAGLQLVAQSHYINVGDAALETQDSLEVFTTDADLSTLIQLHLLVVSVNNFAIPALASEYSASAGCTLDKDVTLLSLTPHMHENGRHIELRIGDTPAIQPIMAVQGWTADMRDLPPITAYGVANAASDGRFTAGQSVALTCSWQNTSTTPLTFPAEMCAAVGYFTTQAPNAGDITCIGMVPRQLTGTE